MEIIYQGEDLGISKLGHVLMILSFVAVAFTSLSYYYAQSTGEQSWKRIGRIAFRIHSLGVLSLVILLFYLLINHRYEYLYVFKHSNDIMPLKYILSCFWAGQEGSFLLWIICHVILGNILQLTSKSWEAPVMCIYALVQSFLVAFLLGIVIPEGYAGGLFIAVITLFPILLFYKKLPSSYRLYLFLGALATSMVCMWYGLPGFQLGSNPFVLLTRDSDILFANDAFYNENYVDLLQGQGLNPLLQNYWMTIHPPTLFMGFASTLIPFSFAIAGLWTKKMNEWMTPTLPWIYFGVMILGAGILMGGAWAYESLTFGGFWAWDPVENASLFPWLTFVGAAHIMLVQRRRGESSYASFILTMFSFLFVIYSTYLTRSGVLSDTSVHSFASGSSGQILLFLFFFYWISGLFLLKHQTAKLLFSFLALFLVTYNNLIDVYIVPVNIISVITVLAIFIIDYAKYFDKGSNKEDHFSSREFWILIGSVILMISCLQLLFNTSLPVFNQLFGINKVLNKTDIVIDYAVPQMIIGTFLCIIMGYGLFLKYKKTPGNLFWKYYTIIAGLSLVICLLSFYFVPFDFGKYSINKIFYPLFFWASLTTVIGNLTHFIFITKGSIKKSGASIAHLGFGLIMLGSFISTSQSKVISQNTSDFNVAQASDGELSNEENIRLLQGDTLPMGNYYVTYTKKYMEHVNVYYEIEYYKKVDGKFVYDFTLKPFIQTNEQFGRVSEPDTRHYWLRDIYTHITSASVDTTKGKTNFVKVQKINISPQESVQYQNLEVKFNRIEKFTTEENADSIEVHLNITDTKGTSSSLVLPFVIYKNKFYPISARNEQFNLIGELIEISPLNNEFSLYLAQEEAQKDDYVILKAILFPLINLLWLGCVLMVIGSCIAIFHRMDVKKKLNTNQ